MEEDKLSLKEIEKITGIPTKTLSEIRAGKIWKNISNNYNFPKIKTIASRIGIDYETNKLLKKLAKTTNMSPKEICKKLNIEYNKKIYNIIYFSRYSIKNNKMTKVQRPSKTPEQIKYEEEFIFKI